MFVQVVGEQRLEEDADARVPHSVLLALCGGRGVILGRLFVVAKLRSIFFGFFLLANVGRARFGFNIVRWHKKFVR